MIRLFTTAFAERNRVRRAEYAECLIRNLGCDGIDSVCVLAEGPVDFPRSQKLVVRKVETRPLYADYFGWIAELAGSHDISIIANADIHFDSSLRVLRHWTIPDRTVLALSRWEASPDGQLRLNDRNDSQDAWIFRGPPSAIFDEFQIGVPRCDNRLAKELEIAGYRVMNPAFTLRAIHLHAGSRDDYSEGHQSGFIDGPYGYVWPHNLLPLHYVIRYRATHRDGTVAWQFDKRYWRRRLKIHWLERLSSELTRPFRRRPQRKT